MHSMISFPGVILFLLFLSFLSFFISASETSIIALSKIRLRHMVAKGVKRSQNIHRLTSKLDKFITAILITNNFVNIAMSAIITVIFVHIFGDRWGIVAATLISVFFILIICEITPKILAIKHTEKIALYIAPLWEIIIKLLRPLINIFMGISNLILKMFRVGCEKRSPLITEEELRMMIEIGQEEGILSDEEKRMFQRIFEFGNTKVKEVMVPKEEIVGVSVNTTPENLLNIFVEEGHARLPVYKETMSNVIGIVYAHDLLYILRDKGLFLLQDLLHEPYYVPGGMRVNELLKVFQRNKIQIAIVVDEHKRTIGLVTLEDLIEEIIGEIEESANAKHKHQKH